VACALALNNQKDETLTLDITLAMGEYFQIQVTNLNVDVFENIG